MKIAISGTYSTGKTTTTLALAHLTGIPRTHAKTMREILPKALPGKRLEDCNMPELFQLAIRRYSERVLNEGILDNDFFSDGSSLHEWVYGKGRLTVGINPNDKSSAKSLDLKTKEIYSQFIENLGSVVKQHAQETYDEFIHLPVEFPLVEDGHRPVSEEFRALSDQLLLESVKSLDIPYHIISGTIPERLQKIIDLYHFEPVMTIEEAINITQKETEQMKIEIEQFNNKIIKDQED